MTTIILTAVICLLIGALLLATALFFWYLLKIVRKLHDTVSEFTRVIDPLIKTGALQTLAGSSAQMVNIGNQVLGAMKAINTTVALFNKAFFNQKTLETVAGAAQTESPEPYAPEGESAIFSYSEPEQAMNEKAEKLRKAGIETDPARAGAPSLEQMKGANV